MRKNWISIALLIVAVGLSVCAWFLLPEVVAVQVSTSGQVTNTMPKWLAILIPLGISAVGSVMYMTRREANGLRSIVISLVGIGAMILELLFNL